MGVLTLSATLPEELRTTASLLAIAVNPELVVRHLRWPAMERVLRLLRRSFAGSETDPLAGREIELVELVRAWVRICLDGPVAPSHSSTRVVQLQQELEMADAALGSERVKALREAVELAVATEHPAADAVAELISLVDMDFPDAEDDQPNCVLIVRGDGAMAARQWVRSENLCADVVTPSQARTAAPWKHAILFGPPDRYVASAWLRGAQAAATAGWLLLAPPAAAVTVLTWAGHQRVLPDSYAPWQAAPTTSIRFESDELAIEDVVPDAYPEVEVVRAPSFARDGGERVDAQGVQFQHAGHTLLSYFSRRIGSKPLTVLDDDGVELVSVPITTVKVGDCLLFKTSVAGLDALDSTTAEWFLTHHDESQHHAAILQQSTLKKWMTDRLLAFGQQRVVNDLIAHGIEPKYAQMLPPRLLHDEFIAPQYYHVYEKLCQALGVAPLLAEFTRLKILRTARRQAGLMLSRRIANRLAEIPDLAGHLRDSGGLVLTSEGVEGVALMVVRNVGIDTVSVPPSRLGTLINEDGRSWHR